MARWFYTPADCSPWACERGHVSSYPYSPAMCPRSACGSRSFVPATAAQVRADAPGVRHDNHDSELARSASTPRAHTLTRRSAA
jgi:hypothetical protein